MGNGWYLPEGFRQELMLRVREACARHGISFASCREGFHHLHTSPSCDGSHLIKRLTQPLAAVVYQGFALKGFSPKG